MLRFTLPRPGTATLSVHDATGRLIRVLANETFESGEQRVAWDGLDEGGLPVAAGSYYSKLSADGVEVTSKLVLVR